MKLRVITFVALMILAMAATAFAQAPATHPRAHGMRQAGARAANDLGLSQDQMTQIRDIVKNYRSGVQGIVKSTATKDQKKDQIKALREKATSDINALLTPGQRTKAQQTGFTNRVLSLRREGAMRMEWVLKQLNLTDAQKATVKGIMQDSKTKAQAIRQDKTLTDDARKAKLQDLRKATMAQIRATLTPEQQQKMDEIIKKGPRQGEKGSE